MSDRQSRTPTLDLPRSKVWHRKIDSETGEIMERVVPAADFKPDAQIPDPPAPPVKPSPPMGSVGRIAVQWPAYEQAKEEHTEAKEVYKAEAEAWWEHFAERLTVQEKADLARGRIVAVNRPFEPAWERGTRLPITDKLTAIVQGTEKIEDGFRTEVVIEDFRSFYLKPIVGGSSKPKSDENGFGIPVDQTTEEQARLDGAYTQAGDAFDAGDVLEDKLYQRLHAEAAMKTAMAQAGGRRRISVLRLEQRLEDARRKHQRSTAKALERKIKAARAAEEKAA